MPGVYLISIHYLIQAAIERSERADAGCIFDKYSLSNSGGHRTQWESWCRCIFDKHLLSTLGGHRTQWESWCRVFIWQAFIIYFRRPLNSVRELMSGASLFVRYLSTGGASIYRLWTHACMDASLFSCTQGETGIFSDNSVRCFLL